MNEKSGTAKVQAENTAKTQAEAVIYDIMDYITGHDLKPGDRLPSERELADMFHVGRPAIREASRALCVMSVIEIRQNSGMYIASFDGNSKLDYFKIHMQAGKFTAGELFQLRLILETECIGMAVQRMSDEQIAIIRETLEHVSIDEEAAFAAADIKMHKIIYEATGNRPLQLIMETISGWNVENRRYTNSFIEVRKIVHRDHLDIYSALESRDVERCKESMRQHILHLQEIDDISQNALRQSYSKLLNNSRWLHQTSDITE